MTVEIDPALACSLIGILAMRVGFGLRGGRITDPGGVLMQLLRQPFGLIVLTVIGTD